MPADFDITIIGGGVIGLACARALASDASVLLVEQHALFGSETSSRNSEVIHAGLYYPSGSLKERLCIHGREALYRYCDTADIPHRKTGKLIVAPYRHHPELARLQTKGSALGIPLQRLDATSIRELEPLVEAQEALYSPETGIIDSHLYMQRLAQDAERLGGVLMKQTGFVSALPEESHWRLSLNTDDGLCNITSRQIINAAGLHSHRVALACGTPSEQLPPLYFCRGHYFSYQAKAPFQRLIYPLPEKNLAGLGIHATLDLGGQVRFGPDTEYLNTTEADYSVSPALRDQFASAVRSYFPALDAEQLQPAYAGIRPKLSGPGEASADFALIVDERDGIPPLLHLMGIESPGLTSSLALADEVRQRLITM